MAVAGGQGRRVVVVPDHLAVGRGGSFHSRGLLLMPGLLGFQHTDARVHAGRRGLQTGLQTGA